METSPKTIAKGIIAFIVVIFVLILVFGSFGTVGAGERGIKTRFGAVVGIVPQGLYWKMPITEHVTIMEIKTRAVVYEKENPLTAASKDLQDVQVTSVVNYHIDPALVEQIFVQFKGVDEFEAQVIRPEVRDTVKAASAQFTAEELVTNRPAFTDLVFKLLNERLVAKGVIIEQSNITDIKFSDAFTQSIEAKVTAQQNAEAAKNNLEKVKFEQQAQIEVAKAQAESIRIQSQAVAAQGGEDYVRLKLLEKWNGATCTSNCFGSGVSMPLPILNVGR